MQQLDNNKIPKLGSVGEKHRILQLITQLPKSDLSIDRCRNLKTTEQKQEYENFCQTRDADAMDVGQVKECAKANMVCRSGQNIARASMTAYALCKKCAKERIMWVRFSACIVNCNTEPTKLSLGMRLVIGKHTVN